MPDAFELIHSPHLHRQSPQFAGAQGPLSRDQGRVILARLERRTSEYRLRRVGLFSADEVGRLVHEHLTGAQNHQRSLWTLLTFELWREAYLSGNAWT